MKTAQYQPFKTALVALDLSYMDEHLIRYTAMLSKVLPLERIFFVHVAKDLELPDEVLTKYPDLLAPLDETIETDINKKIATHFGDSEVEVSCTIKEGSPIQEILKMAKIKIADLIIMGRKKSLEGSGLVTSHLARKCPSSLLLVTEGFNKHIHNILVPVDFSGHAALAAKHALAMADNSEAKVQLAHVFTVPSGYSKMGKTYEQFAEIMKSHASHDCENFLRIHELPKDLNCEYLLNGENKFSRIIYNEAKELKMDLIILGSKGRTDASSILMGSQAEKLAYADGDIPILIVKNKGENMGFLETLLGL
ncbi:MAG: universal stress protein [Bacteroidota bacterium]